MTKLYHDAGLKGASSHSRRHSFASRLIYRGATVQDVSLLLGHASTDDSLRYIEPSPAIMRQACEEVI
ncbi:MULTISPECIES: tyrosine-type recombinase/integrase [unclassified Burkholderia]|uniref:tyrosine-type recombinase/integrase n=1 Tax=unclassified Burkholderia TaxID=2613784 RepID=UPI002AB18AF2|nr:MULTISPECIES: tyrosine-type recombinase/integrase [unclassified Burkholderia]